MANVFDAAAYILKRAGEMSAMKLQKLVYYSQAWSLVWDDKALFKERIEAWANGPVCPDLYKAHAGLFKVNAKDFNGKTSNLTSDEKETIDVVLEHYGTKEANYLSRLTHMEDPWKEAREGLAAGERGNNVISHAAMAEYYDAQR